MFCPKCGAGLVEANQSYCRECGSELNTSSETPQLIIERPRQAPINTSQSPPIYSPHSISQQKLVKKEGGPGTYSIICFCFALASIGLAIGGLIIGVNSMIFSIFTGMGGGLFESGFRPGLIVAIVLNFIGLICGIISKVNSTKAGKMEPENTLEKIGSVVGIFGIIINAILIILGSIITFFRFVLNNTYNSYDPYY